MVEVKRAMSLATGMDDTHDARVYKSGGGCLCFVVAALWWGSVGWKPEPNADADVLGPESNERKSATVFFRRVRVM